MTWDEENRMMSYTDENSNVTEYTYSADGLRRSTTGPDGGWITVWDGTDYLQERS